MDFMSIFLLRTLTKKSKFIGGKYKNQSVETVINIDPQYIRYEYFCLSGISFTKDILLMVGVDDKFRIDKPGVNKEMLHKCNIECINKLSDGERISYLTSQKIKRRQMYKNRLMNINSSNRITNNKDFLRSINHGVKEMDQSYHVINNKRFGK